MESGARQNQFQSTHSLRSATVLGLLLLPLRDVSIHALLAECDRGQRPVQLLHRCFNPRTPCGVRLWCDALNKDMSWFQSTHSLRSATAYYAPAITRELVSIHALLAECDTISPGCKNSFTCFNPRTPCGVRLITCGHPYRKSRFQSTHSLRSATSQRWGRFSHQLRFNPRTPCGVRLRLTIYIVIQQRKRYFAPTSRRRPSSPSLLL